MKNLQMNGQTDGRIDRRGDDRWSEKLTWAFSSDELKMLTYFSQYRINCSRKWHFGIRHEFTINNVNIQHNRVDIQLTDVHMLDNYVNMWLIYVKMRYDW